MPPNRPILPWKRYWCPLGADINLGMSGNGFLTDPEDKMGRIFNPNVREIGQLLDLSCLVLVGEPGLGKTTALNAIRPALVSRLSSERNLLWEEMRSVPDATTFRQRVFQTNEWMTWRSSQQENLVLVVDGVDEGLMRLSNFVPFLTRELEGVPRERLQVILACRTADWPTAQGDSLLRQWSANKNQPHVWELCPLRQTDARLATEQSGVDPDAFIKALYANGTVGLASRPVTLFFLLQSKNFAGTRTNLYEQGCLKLCEEQDRPRVESQQANGASRPTPRQLYQVAARIAYVLMLSGKSAVYSGESGGLVDSDINIDNLTGRSETVNGIRFSVTDRIVEEALKTALFSSRGPDRIGFAHQTFAEHMAAQYLRCLPLVQIRRVLCHRDGPKEHVTPQLAETAAWLASLHNEFYRFLIDNDPQVLFRSDIAHTKQTDKASVVAALLEGAKNEEIFDDNDTRYFYSGLRHPGLAGQIQAYIGDRSINVIARRMAMEMVRACALSEATDGLLAVAEDATEDAVIRHSALRALADVLPSDRAIEMVPFAEGRVGPDPDDDLKAYALRVLVPSIWTVTEALPCLTPPQRSNYLGAYYLVLHDHIPRHIRTNDLVPLLMKLLEWDRCFERTSPRRHIADRTMTLALKSLSKPQISDLVVDVWWSKARRHLPLLERLEDDLELSRLLKEDERTRLQLVESLLNSAKTTEDDVYHIVAGSTRLFGEPDLLWLLERISDVPESRRGIWAEAIAWCYRISTEDSCLDLLLDRIERIQALKEKFSWVRFYPFDDEETGKIRANWLRRQRDEIRWRPTPLDPPRDFRMQSDLARIAAGTAAAWITLCRNMAIREEQPHDYEYLTKDDVTEFPGWEGASTDLRESIRQAARTFLIFCDDIWLDDGRSTNSTHAGYLAVGILRDRISFDEILRNGVSEEWIRAIVSHLPHNNSQEHEAMVALAYSLNPVACQQLLASEIRREDEQHGDVNVLSTFRGCWDRDLSQTVKTVITSPFLKPKSVASIIRFLSEVDADCAAECVALVLPEIIEGDPTLYEKASFVLATALTHLSARTWDTTWPRISNDQDLAANIFLSASNYSEWPLCEELSDSQLADLYLLIYKIFPPVEDQETTDDSVPRRRDVDSFRSAVVNALVARGTDESCRQLLRLAAELPDQKLWLHWRYQEALRTKRRTEWTPLTPRLLLDLAAKSSARLVNNEDDLIEVIVESLERFQEVLTTKSLPRAANLWNYEGGGNQRHNFSPKDEEDLSDEVARWLKDDLSETRAIVLNREVQPRRGQKTDIWVDAISNTVNGIQKITVVIEVKGCWNGEVKTAMKTQLVDRYLQANGLTHGIYVVGWYVCDRWDRHEERKKSCLESHTFGAAMEEIHQLAALYDGKSEPFRVSGIVLDCRYPS